MKTLRQFHNRCRELTEKGYEVWIEGRGDGSFKLVIEGLEIRGDLDGRTRT